MQSFRFSVYKTKSSANRGNFHLSFSIWTYFIIYFYCLIVLPRTYRNILNRNVSMGTLFLILEEKSLYLSLLNMILSLTLLYMSFITFKCVPSKCKLFSFYHENMFNFMKFIFISIKMITWFWSFILSICVTFIDLHIMNHLCPLGTHPMRSWCMIFFKKKFYCYSVTVMCLSSPSLHTTPAEPTSLPHLHHLP